MIDIWKEGSYRLGIGFDDDFDHEDLEELAIHCLERYLLENAVTIFNNVEVEINEAKAYLSEGKISIRRYIDSE